ncbi:hypothetical protein F5Y13DRAFT_43116 [Hypoxylon sp. FL1857]|nr:hypothetical protein F5Y13DRAFT_43116 [Hypoxylon sp. FL1857]
MQHLTDSLGDQRINVGLAVSPCNPPTDPTAFHGFPARRGYQITQDFIVEPDGSERNRDYASFMQEWLFFGLILTAVRTDGKPFITCEQLISGDYITTEPLSKALDDWEEYEARNQSGIEYRMIQTEYVLERARQVIRKNCAVRDSKVLYSKDTRYPKYLSDESALSLMTVGEALSAAKKRIMENAKVNISGWHADDDAGWGPPYWVFRRMNSDKRDERWCPRAMYLLKGQLGANATLMLAAYRRCEHSDRMTGSRHDNCVPSDCKVVDRDEHIDHCTGCEKHGPPMHEILRLLRTPVHDLGTEITFLIPLLVFEGPEDHPQLRVEAQQPSKTYAAISHVWSDGWGNEEENKLTLCRLRFIRARIQDASGKDRRDIPFWMDTLVVPVDKTVLSLRKIAIGQITNVFEGSSFTIVLDNGLLSMPTGGKPAEEAMGILPSRWMRRLWTLQEAFLSHKILLAFERRGRNERDMIDFDHLDLELAKGTSSVANAFDRAVRNQLLSQLMGNERADRKHFKRVRRESERGAILVASAWSAARWRTTGNPAHEVLAIATLLGLDYKGTKIEDAGLEEDPNPTFLNELVRDFWITFDEQFRSAIPPGLIFLPGRKIEGFEGFGWAPRTWLSAHEIDYPDPLSTTRFPTSLDKTAGLRVQYPGFLLHTQKRKTILGVDENLGKFTFPIDRGLTEWYSVQPADKNSSSHIEAYLRSESPLAIIISRPRPRTSKHEIGLLVEVYKTTRLKKQNGLGGPASSDTTFFCQVIHRVHIWREMTRQYTVGHGNITQFSSFPEDRSFRNIVCGASPEHDDCLCIGEALEEYQEWYVDGYRNRRSKAFRRSDLDHDNGGSLKTTRSELQMSKRHPTWPTTLKTWQTMKGKINKTFRR